MIQLLDCFPTALFQPHMYIRYIYMFVYTFSESYRHVFLIVAIRCWVLRLVSFSLQLKLCETSGISEGRVGVYGSSFHFPRKQNRIKTPRYVPEHSKEKIINFWFSLSQNIVFTFFYHTFQKIKSKHILRGSGSAYL